MASDRNTGFWRLMDYSIRGIVTRPVCWVGFFILPLFMFLFMGDLMKQGLPTRVPAAIVDLDRSDLSRGMVRNLDGMQMVHLTEAAESYTQARHLMQEGKIYGFFIIPRDFEKDIFSGRGPVVTFYTNMTYFVPANMLFKNFKLSATYAKAGVLLEVARDAGLPTDQMTGMINPISTVTHPLGNPWLNYAYYLSVSFTPAALHLMIILMTCFTLGQNIKYGRSRRMLEMANGSIVKTVSALLLPQSVVWVALSLLLESWLFRWLHFPMNGSWWWLTLSNVMFVFASQGFGLLLFAALPNLRLSLSVGALIGILTFSIGCFSFPYESMYPAVGIFSWILPMRYQYLIYIDQALNGLHIYYSRWWYVAYIIFMVAPLTLLWRVKKAYASQDYVP